MKWKAETVCALYGLGSICVFVLTFPWGIIFYCVYIGIKGE